MTEAVPLILSLINQYKKWNKLVNFDVSPLKERSRMMLKVKTRSYVVRIVIICILLNYAQFFASLGESEQDCGNLYGGNLCENVQI